MRTDPETQRVLFQAVAESGDPDIASCISKYSRKVYELIHQLVARACEEGYLSAPVNSDAAAWGYMSMILALQYGSMLNLAEPIARVQEETCRIWLRGLLSHEGQ
jgi:hypothetical protein